MINISCPTGSPTSTKKSRIMRDVLDKEVWFPVDETNTIEGSPEFEWYQSVVVGEGGIQKITTRDVTGLSEAGVSNRIEIQVVLGGAAIYASSSPHLLCFNHVVIGIV